MLINCHPLLPLFVPKKYFSWPLNTYAKARAKSLIYSEVKGLWWVVGKWFDLLDTLYIMSIQGAPYGMVLALKE